MSCSQFKLYFLARHASTLRSREAYRACFAPLRERNLARLARSPRGDIKNSVNFLAICNR